MLADSTRNDTWNTYDVVKSVSDKFSGIGIVFDGSMLGIDLDHILKDSVIQDAVSSKFVEVADTYTEISPSGTGLHTILKLSEPLVLVAHTFKPNGEIKYECYNEKRFFTVTENIFQGHDKLRSVSAEEALKLLSILGYPWVKALKKPLKASKSDLTDAEVLNILFSASNGAKSRRIYEGDNSDYNGDVSAGDSSLCCMLAFYTNKDPQAIERIWLASPRGSREKVQQRKDYRDITIKHAIEVTEDVFKADKSFDKAQDYVKHSTGKVETIPLITENIQVFLNTYKQFAGCFRFNEFTQRIEYKSSGTWRDYKDADALIIQGIISRAHPIFFKVSKSMVEDAILLNALRHSYDSAREFFTSLVWDKVPRLDRWLHLTYATPDDNYHRAVGSNWLKGLAKRAVQPGCKFDYVLVLEAPQGTKKSMSLAIIGNPWHAETTFTPDNKDFFMLMFGNLIVEFSEGETLSRSEVKKLKAVITMQHDDIRLPYDRTVSRHYRRCVFAMTTNEEQYLKDETGNRRWLPVRVGDHIDIEWLTQNRDQLLAEAYHRAIALNETAYEFPQEEMEKAQNERMLTDPLAEKVVDWYLLLSDSMRRDGITTRQAFIGVNPTGDTFGQMSKLDEMRIGSIFRHTMFLIKTRKMLNGAFRNVFVPSQKTLAEFDAAALKDDLFRDPEPPQLAIHKTIQE